MKDNRGGYREGGGRPPNRKRASDAFVRKVNREWDKAAKEVGASSALHWFARRAMSGKLTNAEAGAFRTLMEINTVRETYQTREVRELGPVIGLPPVKPLKVVDGQRKGVPCEKTSPQDSSLSR